MGPAATSSDDRRGRDAARREDEDLPRGALLIGILAPIAAPESALATRFLVNL